MAGPTPRSSDVKSWRPMATLHFEKFGFNGSLFIPERLVEEKFDWESQVKWEEEHMNAADCILFWIPRNLENMPGFTTNVEWGRWENSGKVVLGAPDWAKKMGYIRYYAKKHGVPIAETLEETVRLAIEMVEAK